MMISNIFVPNKELRQKFQHQVDAAGISQLGVLGLVATQTAYEKGDEWYESMLKYVWENIAYVKKYVKDNMPGVNVIDGEEPTSCGWISEGPESMPMSWTGGSSTTQSCGWTAERSSERQEPDSRGSMWRHRGRRLRSA